tara:strand:- start:2902 stop:3231 length:330 start_codon:yes stop_codon:yes gene_type:complete
MSPLEERARKWIMAQHTLLEYQIIFHYRQSPDFTLPDGRGFEVVPIGRERIVLYGQQWQRLLDNADMNYLLCFGESDEPVIIPMTELPLGIARWGKYWISWYHKKEVNL